MSLPLSDSCHTCACIFSSDEICLLAATRRLIQQENEDMSWLKNKVLAPPYARGWKIDHSPEKKKYPAHQIFTVSLFFETSLCVC